MKFYEVTYAIDDAAYEKFSALGKRYEKIRGWDEKKMLQFSIRAMAKDDMEAKLHFLEEQIDGMEKEWLEYQQEPERKKVYISEEEREKCRKVVNAYAEELDDAEVMVVEAGRFGFVRLAYYKFPTGFGDAFTYTDSFELFCDLWEEWFEEQLLRLTKDMPVAELDYDYLFKCLPEERQKELMVKREYFAEKAELSLA